jgi:hypothetical protein
MGRVPTLRQGAPRYFTIRADGIQGPQPRVAAEVQYSFRQAPGQEEMHEQRKKYFLAQMGVRLPLRSNPKCPHGKLDIFCRISSSRTVSL